MARSVIGKYFGEEYLPEKARIYQTKAKNAQEAHEAIRPTDMFKRPESLNLDADQAKLYGLIWKRTLASQMASAPWPQPASRARPGARLPAVAVKYAFGGRSAIWAAWSRRTSVHRSSQKPRSKSGADCSRSVGASLCPMSIGVIDSRAAIPEPDRR